MKKSAPVLVALVLLMGAFAAVSQEGAPLTALPGLTRIAPPVELALERAAGSAGDLRKLPVVRPRLKYRPERPDPDIKKKTLPLPPGFAVPSAPAVIPGPSAAMPSPILTFVGLDLTGWGSGWPPDTNGDVGPSHYIETVNASVGIYRKSDGVQLAAFTFDTLMAQGSFGNLCDTDNFGDPVVLYDTFEDRWILTDFAFQLDGSSNVVNPPGAYQCFAVSKTNDPVAGGWNFYSLHVTDALNDYPKFGVWPDGIYMSANLFGFPSGSAYLGTRVWALNKAQMYRNEPSPQVVQFSPPQDEFTFLPANARLQTGTPPAGSPNYFSTVGYYNALTIYKFHVDWTNTYLSTFTGPYNAAAAASWSAAPDTVSALSGAAIDTLQPRLMMQNQYTNIGGVESVWNSHTVLGGAASTAAPRFYQVTVTGGIVAASATQSFTHAPDTTIQRFMPSLAVDRAGDMAIGYTASSSTLYPSIRYAGRLAADPVNSLPQTETVLYSGTGSQTTYGRWGDYSAMSLDPDGCTFWYTNEYYAAVGTNWQTRIGSFKFPSCTAVSTGTIQGTVTAAAGGAAVSGATVALGNRTAATNASGFYQFTGVAAGTYPSLVASAPGLLSSTVTSLVLSSGGTTTQNFSLSAAATSACPVDTSQADFQAGVPNLIDLSTTPGAVLLHSGSDIDQQNLYVTYGGYGFTSTAWAAQTFVAAKSGALKQVDLNLFCSGCTGTTPNVTVSIRATTGSPALPTGSDLATATVAGFSSGSGGYYSAVFATPATVTAGTKYAIVVRAVSNPSAGTYAYSCSCADSYGDPSFNAYASGQRATSSNSGSTWTADTTSGGRDLGFVTYVDSGYSPSGDLASSTKDANPPATRTPTWTTLSWTGSTPANTSLRFQVAASNSEAGPFSFVGPDGTASTYFTTSGASMSQFNGLRYLKTKALLASTNSAATPTLNDVTVCYSDLPKVVVTGTKTVSGYLAAGTAVTYSVTLSNSGSFPQLDNPGNEFVDVLPASLVLVSANATSGTAVATIATNTVTWNGPIAAGGSVTITIVATIGSSVAGGTVVSNQGTIAYDADGTGTNEATALTDDPSVGGSANPTSFTVRDGFFYPVTPCRLVDTRLANGAYGGPSLTASGSRSFVVAGQCGVPATARAVAINVTSTGTTDGGFFAVYPTGITAPTVAMVSYPAGANKAGEAVVKLGAGGDLTVTCNQATGTANLLIDVSGYFQ